MGRHSSYLLHHIHFNIIFFSHFSYPILAHTTFCTGVTNVVKIDLVLSLICSDPEHIFSRPYIEMLARRSKVDPLSDCPLGDGWKVVELDLDRKMSAARVKCFFAYRGEAWSLSLLKEMLWRQSPYRLSSRAISRVVKSCCYTVNLLSKGFFDSTFGF